MENLLSFSKVESNRFTKKVYRAKLSDFNPSELKKEILGAEADLLILRMPSDNKTKHNKVAKLGFDYIHADTLVYYACDLSIREIPPLKNALKFEQVSDSTVADLKDIIPVIFKNYQNHYSSNPYLDLQNILDGYIEWASAYVKESEGRISWLVKHHDKIAGFATCSFNSNNQECEGVLYGVMPDSSGGGVYADIIRFTQRFFKEAGFRKMLVSTQVQNFAVQKVWSREGFFLSSAWDTFHINSMLSHTISDVHRMTITLTSEDIDQFATFSGDTNELHFQDEFAQKFGFKERIAHGMIPLSYLSKFFGTTYPGEGSIFLESRTFFIKPIYLNQTYQTTISTIDIKMGSVYSLLAKVTDQNDHLCLVSYNTLYNKK